MSENAKVERIVMVATRYGKLTEPDWKPWPDCDFDDVVAEVAERVRENHRPMEVMEVTVVRRVNVSPVVSAVDVTSGGISIPYIPTVTKETTP